METPQQWWSPFKNPFSLCSEVPEALQHVGQCELCRGHLPLRLDRCLASVEDRISLSFENHCRDIWIQPRLNHYTADFLRSSLACFFKAVFCILKEKCLCHWVLRKTQYHIYMQSKPVLNGGGIWVTNIIIKISNETSIKNSLMSYTL